MALCSLPTQFLSLTMLSYAQYFPLYSEALLRDEQTEKFNLEACPEDLSNTWGPGEVIAEREGCSKVIRDFHRRWDYHRE
jgi:hypothetical protein